MTKNDADFRWGQFQRKLLAARILWEQETKANAFATRTAKGNGKRSVEKVLYFVCGGVWLDKMKREIKQFQKQLDSHGPSGRARKRSMWLPNIIDRPRRIRLMTYAATSTREISRTSAKAFAKKGTPLNADGQAFDGPSTRKFMARSRTGTAYRLRVRNKDGQIDYISFTNWVVCVCKSKDALPKLRKAKNLFQYRDGEPTDALFKHGQTTLLCRWIDTPK